MSDLVERILGVSAGWVYLFVGLLVFFEDAVFVGFVLPGETAAILGGADASLGRVNPFVIAAIVVVAAIAGDSVDYQIGRHIGPLMLDRPFFDRRRARIDSARDFLTRRGGTAVFLARAVAFLRAVIPALAGVARMPYRRFLTYNALGALVWGTGFVVFGYLAGDSYAAVADKVGHATVIAVIVVATVAVVIWRIRAYRRAHPRERHNP